MDLGITWNRSFGTDEGAKDTGSEPSWLSMISRPPWNSCPNTRQSWACTVSASRR